MARGKSHCIRFTGDMEIREAFVWEDLRYKDLKKTVHVNRSLLRIARDLIALVNIRPAHIGWLVDEKQ